MSENCWEHQKKAKDHGHSGNALLLSPGNICCHDIIITRKRKV